MGWRFSVNDANTLAWITAPQIWTSSMQLNLNTAHLLLWRLGQNRGAASDAFLSSDQAWTDFFIRLCERYHRDNEDELLFNEQRLLGTLVQIREHLSWIQVYALGIASSWEQHRPLEAFLRNAAYESGPSALFLIPETPYRETGLSVHEPFPAFAKLSNVAVPFPGVLFWSKTGIAHLAALHDAQRIYRRLSEIWTNLTAIEQLLLEESQSEKKNPSFLQISDLHFGAKDVAGKETYLTLQLKKFAEDGNLKQVVITGDLMNGPKRANLQTFNNFKTMLATVLKQEPIVIPGNHDQKRCWGIWNQTYQQLAQIRWDEVIPDDHLHVLFLCFDSSCDAKYARGKVTQNQRLRVATKLESLLNRRPELRKYLRVALVHHHPFSFPETDTGVWRVFGGFGFNREMMLRMDEADEFVSWCALQDVSLILHGHKHVPWHVEADIETDPATGRRERFQIRSVGCGSSSGVGNWPLSINKLMWNQTSRRWCVTFMVDRGDGSGFRDAEILTVAEKSESSHSFGDS